MRFDPVVSPAYVKAVLEMEKPWSETSVLQDGGIRFTFIFAHRNFQPMFSYHKDC